MDAEDPGGLLPIPIQRAQGSKDQQSLVDLEVFLERSEARAFSVMGKEEFRGARGRGQGIRVDPGFVKR